MKKNWKQYRADLRQYWQESGLELFPIWRTLKAYRREEARADAKASVNVALLDFPQGMAYALIAGLPVQAGLVCSALSSLVGPLFASSRHIMLGPTNATAVMLLSTFLTLGFNQAQALVALPVLLLLAGLFMILGGLFRVATITQYVSRAVVSGYITAAAILIIINQLKNVLGLHVPRAGTTLESLRLLVSGLEGTQWQAVAVAGMTLALYFPLKRWLKALPTVAATLVLVAGLTAWLSRYGFHPEMLESFAVTDWPWVWPEVDFETIALLANGALGVTFLSLLESSSIAKTLAARTGDRVNLNQQMLSIGAASVVNAFSGGMAVSGSLTRSVLNYRSGARTAVASIFSGTLLLIGIFSLGPLIAYIPRPALATLVILVGISLINRENIRIMLRTTRSDATVFLLTFGAGMIFPLDTAIYLGAAASILLFVRSASRPDLSEVSFDDKGNIVQSEGLQRLYTARPRVAIIHVEGDLFFGASEVFLDQMRRLVESPETRIIILRLRNARHMDASAALAVGELIRFARERGNDVLVSGVRENVARVFENSGLLKLLGPENFFRFDPSNYTLSTRNALKRAQAILGDVKPEITIVAREKKTDGDSAEPTGR